MNPRVAIVLLFLAAGPVSATRPVARVGPVTLSAADLLSETRQQTAAQGRDLDRLPPGRVYESASQVLHEWIDEQLIAQRAAPESHAAAAAKLARFLASGEVTDWQRRSLLTAFTLEAESRRLGLTPVPPDDTELRAIYDRDPARWAQPAEADIRILVINLPPGDRSARARHQCRETVATATGPWQTLTVRQGQTQPQVELLAWRVPVGQRSPVFQVGPGYAILEVLARRPAVPRSFAAARDQMARIITADREREFYWQLRRDWRATADVEVWLGHDTFGGPARPPVAWPAVTLFALAAAALVWWSGRRWNSRWGAVALGIGIFLRLALWATTPYDWLGHDEEEHLDYIAHVARHLTVPDWTQGFMFYQPPLYYFATGLLGRAVGDPFAVRVYQGFALVAAVAALWFVLDVLHWLAARGPGTRRMTVAVALALAVLPSWAFFATRVNNDVLAALLAFVAAWFLARWWQAGRPWDWWGGMIAIGLGLLTKTTAALLLPVWGMAWCGRTATPWRDRARLAVGGVVIVLALAGWFYGQRFGTERQAKLSGNVAWIPRDSPMWVDRRPATLLTFRPDRLWREPYVHGAMPRPTRDNFWEYFLRTAWYGEFSFQRVPPWLARALVAAGLALTALVLIGFVQTQRRDGRAALPMTILWLVVLAGHVAYRQLVPLNGSQDFRYSIILLLPAAWFLTQAPRGSQWLLGGWSALAVLFLGFVLAR